MQCPVWNSCPCSCTSWGPPWGSCSCAPRASCAHPSRGISWGWPPHCAPGDQPPHEPYQPSRPPLCRAAAAPRTPLRPVVAGPVSLCQEEVSWALWWRSTATWWRSLFITSCSRTPWVPRLGCPWPYLLLQLLLYDSASMELLLLFY